MNQELTMKWFVALGGRKLVGFIVTQASLICALFVLKEQTQIIIDAMVYVLVLFIGGNIAEHVASIFKKPPQG